MKKEIKKIGKKVLKDTGGTMWEVTKLGLEEGRRLSDIVLEITKDKKEEE